jgi:hypothetical protein
MNFCYSVCLLLGAFEAGVLDPSIDEIELVDDFSNHLVRTDPIVRRVIDAWATFWKDEVRTFVAETFKLAKTEDSSRTRTLSTSRQFERLYDAMNVREWAVHSLVFRLAVFEATKGALPKRMMDSMPNSERKFALGFCKIVELFAALNWRTDLTTTLENGPGYMPLEVLHDGDHKAAAGRAQPSPAEQKRQTTVVEMHKLSLVGTESLGAMVSFWRRVGRWQSVRTHAGTTIHNLTHGTLWQKTQELSRVCLYFWLPASRWESTVWAIAAAAGGFVAVNHRNGQPWELTIDRSRQWLRKATQRLGYAGGIWKSRLGEMGGGVWNDEKLLVSMKDSWRRFVKSLSTRTEMASPRDTNADACVQDMGIAEHQLKQMIDRN